MSFPTYRRAAAWLGQVAAWGVLLAALAVLTAAVLIPRATGATPYSVDGGSMAPGLEVGDLIAVRPRDPTELGVGSVITFQLESGVPTVATHRIVAMGYARGAPIFQTRGDANDVADAEWVRPVQIRGEVWYRVPYLGHAHSALSRAQHHLVTTAVAGGLLAYAAWMFASTIRERRNRSEAVVA